MLEPSSAYRSKPLLRGVSHEIAAFAAIPVSLALVAGARSSSAQMGAATYCTTLFMLFFVSALFHRPTWSQRARLLMGRLDNSAIFLLIAGTSTPFCLVLGGGLGRTLFVVVWTGALMGIVLSVAWPVAPKPLMASLYVLLGWVSVVAAPGIWTAMGRPALLLLVAGGLVYTAGAIVYALRRPDPFPRVFGYHEIFHLLVVAAAACHFVAIRAAVHALG